MGKSTAANGPLFWRRPPDHPGKPNAPAPDLAVRDKQWKLLCDIHGKHAQLYDLTEDIGEANNLAKSNLQITKRLKQAVLKWNDTLPVDGVGATDPIRQ
ncbi:MAG: hypothetical protein R3C56_42035 [Pirellulaceae bacterium]